jgi:hypothetical protein
VARYRLGGEHRHDLGDPTPEGSGVLIMAADERNARINVLHGKAVVIRIA